MKTWTNPEVVNLNISETEEHLLGFCHDGGEIGDGHMGQLGEKCTKENPCLLHLNSYS